MTKHEQDTILRLADYLDGIGDYEGGIVEDRREEAAATLRTISAQLTSAQNERDEFASAIDSIETSGGLTDNGNMWRFWAKKAREANAKLTAALAREAALLDAIDRLIPYTKTAREQSEFSSNERK